MISLSAIKPTKTLDIERGVPAATRRIVGRELGRIRRRILLRDNYTCQVCGRVSRGLEVDHITPLSLGGSESDENRWSLCVECHRAKSEKEEKERGK